MAKPTARHSLTVKLLRANEHLRSDDRRLMLRVWAQEGLVLTPEQKKAFMKVTHPESICRTRRNHRAEMPGTKAVELHRYKNFKYMRDAIINGGGVGVQKATAMADIENRKFHPFIKTGRGLLKRKK